MDSVEVQEMRSRIAAASGLGMEAGLVDELPHLHHRATGTGSKEIS